MPVTRTIAWNEPNRRNTPPLHIASRGERYSTLTGVWWLDENRFVANHRSGLRMALFDLREGDAPIVIAPVPHLSDDIAARDLGDGTWEIAASGCWDCAYSIHRLSTQGTPGFRPVEVKPSANRTFSHGIAYDTSGKLWLAFHTGEDPRIETRGRVWRLPPPWGARDVCFDANSGHAYAVAVSKNPTLTAYQQVATSIWHYDPAPDSWNMIDVIDNVHSDACQIYAGRIWLPDQVGDRVLGVDLSGRSPPVVIQDKSLDFPHGLGISDNGSLAIANYGNSSIALFNLNHRPKQD
ncbi:MAG TPA: hypothetical protein PKD77_11730 [Rudaea sp.]|nr:hypothetical protein [Rudaea sp.]